MIAYGQVVALTKFGERNLSPPKNDADAAYPNTSMNIPFAHPKINCPKIMVTQNSMRL